MAGAEYSDLPVIHIETAKALLSELHLSTLMSQMFTNSYLLLQSSQILCNYVVSSHLHCKHLEL